ncbi:hypothetical protein EGR_00693 [Echinococcus granulosus]|uniref:Uncharacterized protein n=1 Tax=Echinococcus granulosus TaxID=6210 RepID=W6VBF6_ECHGR|nr:hypothetical protein EGR_00693 [Echinococcus granulosus]EUB64149.1 hypothetical protein EGR_00693 [Echinococcus granulosus]
MYYFCFHGNDFGLLIMPTLTTSRIDKLNDILVSAASSDAISMLIQSIDENADFTVEDPPTTHLPDTAKIFESLSQKQKQVDEYTRRIDDLRERIRTMRQRVLEKLKDAGYNDGDVPLFYEEANFKVNHLTSIMVKKREFLEEAIHLRDIEKEKLDVSQREANTTTNVQQSPSPEADVNTLIEKWMNSRLGDLSLLDNTHVVLDTSASSILKDNPTTSPASGGRIRCLLKQPHNCEAAFGVDNLHPLGGSMEAMKIAQAATQAMTPSVAVNYAIWKQLSETIK